MTTSDTQEAGKGAHTPTPEILLPTDEQGVFLVEDRAVTLAKKVLAERHKKDRETFPPETTREEIIAFALLKRTLTAVNSHSTLTEENARLLQENKAMKELLDKIARDLPQRGPNGFEDFSTAYSRIKHMARTAALTTTNDGGGK